MLVNQNKIILQQGDTLKEFARDELTEDEQKIIEKLLQSPAEDHPADPAVRKLHDLLVNEKEIPINEWNQKITFPLRLIYVRFTKVIEDREGFTEAMEALFPGSHIFLWRSQKEGLLIQEADEEFEVEIESSSIVDTLAADFFTRPTIFIGSFIHDPARLKAHADWENHLFHEVTLAFPKKHLFHEQELTLYYLLSRFSDKTLSDVSRLIAPVASDTTLLESVRCYLECNMNTSLAAKKMYMHRNTMQYRVDKFIEKTAVDIKQFPNAVAVYLMLLAIPVLYKED
ncbi:PucR family transcriptional regulator [Alkalicoccus daliensis]|uniref:PucR C-terminal helix-turn-helix domain-containing protein n=1 Tax=Alkalicoccus daliensis TaxID=745820 RepID=A0A1H0IEK5_9BACI|nr:helix-turn-helix domain-containing protein [Alkalicoccus daliensis]SDO29720.1 PucR C-terminal helix-turn-helix domain-containing protein [Alkalicoccus daliensis]